MQHPLRIIFIAGLTLSTYTLAFANNSEQQHREKTVAQHQAMAKIHTEAAQCISKAKDEAGEKACHDTLQKACKGIGIGKFCGMKHGH